jgi:hypothetical protein
MLNKTESAKVRCAQSIDVSIGVLKLLGVGFQMVWRVHLHEVTRSVHAILELLGKKKRTV